jgi:regulator of protease activity HflC (stomatin/prohibitin superfamily)
MIMIIFLVIILVLIGFFVIKFIECSYKSIIEHERGILLKFGKFREVRGPGWVFAPPRLGYELIRVDIREQYQNMSNQTCITKDNISVNINGIIYWKVTDPGKSILTIKILPKAIHEISLSILQTIIGMVNLEDLLSNREHINSLLNKKLNNETKRWGVFITNYELHEIRPPHGVVEAMQRQIEAVRYRDVKIIETQAIHDAKIIEAQSEKKAAILEAEGISSSLYKIMEIAKTLDNNTMILKYLEKLKDLGATKSTKYIFPLEFTKFVTSFSELFSNSEK